MKKKVHARRAELLLLITNVFIFVVCLFVFFWGGGVAGYVSFKR